MSISLGLFALALLTAFAGSAKNTLAPNVVRTVARGVSLSRSGESCGVGQIPDGDACVTIPGEDEGAPDAPITPNLHRDHSGRWSAYDQIPRRPERPRDYDAYRYPVPPGLSGGHSVISGYDLDQPDATQRRGPHLHAIGHGGVDIPEPRGTPVRLVVLEHQQGDAEIVFAGDLFGTTVLTRHTVREGAGLRDYLVLYGHLDAVAAGAHVGARVKDSDVLGFVGDTGSPELVHLHLEVRRVRDGVDVIKRAVTGAALLAPDVSVVCDPRNVLPLRG